MFFTKEELIKRLRADPLYRDALKMAQTDAERRRIIATTEGFLASFVESMSPIASQIGQDPQMAAQLQDAIMTGVVVKENDGKPMTVIDDKRTNEKTDES